MVNHYRSPDELCNCLNLGRASGMPIVDLDVSLVSSCEAPSKAAKQAEAETHVDSRRASTLHESCERFCCWCQRTTCQIDRCSGEGARRPSRARACSTSSNDDRRRHALGVERCTPLDRFDRRLLATYMEKVEGERAPWTQQTPGFKCSSQGGKER